MAALASVAEAASNLETVGVCDLCGSDQFTLRRVWKDPLGYEPKRWNLVRCDACSLHFINPRPTRDTIGDYYPADYSAHTAPRAMPKRWHRRYSGRDAPPMHLWERVWMHVRQNVSWYQFPAWQGEGRVLDIGCGSGGRYLDVLKGLGWQTFGMDPSPAAVAAAVEKGHSAVRAVAEEQPFPDASMDVVTVWHVLEHTHSPTRALASAYRMLRPGGTLSLCVPNWGSLHAAIFDQGWQSCEPPRHLYQLTKPTLKRYVKEAGFQIVRFGTRTGATAWSRNARLTINNLFGTRWATEPKLLVTIFDPYVAFLSLFNFFGVGAELRLLARKPA